MLKINHFIKSSEIEFSLEEFEDNNMSRSHTHNTFELYFLMEGSRRLLLKNNFYRIKKGDILLISPGVMHKTLNTTPPEYKRLVINFPSRLIESIVTKSEFAEKFALKDAIIVTNPEAYDSITKTIEDLEQIIAEKGFENADFEIMTAAYIYKLLYLIVSGENVLTETKIQEKNSERISLILDFLNRNFTHQITLTQLSSKFFLSEFHLCRSFKKATGRTVVEYINYLRLEKAKLMLTETDKPIGEIAKMCGFKSQAHFNHIFREYEIYSPREYRAIRK